MVKIHIIGGPGSGKTTLAQDLSSKLHIPHYDLDKVNGEPESSIALALQPAWITEGIYLIVTEPMLYHADYIVLLEVSAVVAAWRIIRRHLLNSLRGTQAYPGLNGIKLLFKLLLYTRRYYFHQPATTRPSLEALQSFIETHQESAAPPTEAFMQKYVETDREIVAPPTQTFVQQYLERYKKKVFLVKNTTDREHLFALLTNK